MDEPSEWSLVIFNDDYTPIGIVAYMCVKILHMTEPQAISFANSVDKNGSGKFGCFPKSIAEAKKDKIEERVSSLGYPLKIEVEKQNTLKDLNEESKHEE